MSQPLDKQQAGFMKVEKCSGYKKKSHITYDCHRKEKVAVISESIITNKNSNRKEWLFVKSRKRAYLLLHHLCWRIYFERVFLLFSVDKKIRLMQ